MLQNHVAVTKSMDEVTLPGIMQIDKVIACKHLSTLDIDEAVDQQTQDLAVHSP